MCNSGGLGSFRHNKWTISVRKSSLYLPRGFTEERQLFPQLQNIIICSCAGNLLAALSVIISYIVVSFRVRTEPCFNACVLKAIEGRSYP